MQLMGRAVLLWPGEAISVPYSILLGTKSLYTQDYPEHLDTKGRLTVLLVNKHTKGCEFEVHVIIAAAPAAAVVTANLIIL